MAGRDSERTPQELQVPPNPELAPRDARAGFVVLWRRDTSDSRSSGVGSACRFERDSGPERVRSFRRMESAIGEMVAAIRSGNHARHAVWARRLDYAYLELLAQAVL